MTAIGYIGQKSPSLFLFCITECMMDDGSASAIFWKQEAPVAAAEGNFDFQEIASFLPTNILRSSSRKSTIHKPMIITRDKIT